jgi:hypothetical protein
MHTYFLYKDFDLVAREDNRLEGFCSAVRRLGWGVLDPHHRGRHLVVTDYHCGSLLGRVGERGTFVIGSSEETTTGTSLSRGRVDAVASQVRRYSLGTGAVTVLQLASVIMHGFSTLDIDQLRCWAGPFKELRPFPLLRWFKSNCSRPACVTTGIYGKAADAFR